MRWKFIDRVLETDESSWIKAEKTFPLYDDWHQDHFPNSPVIPGVLQIEVIANLAGKLILMRALKENKAWEAPILFKTQECKFNGIVRPGELIEAEVRFEKFTRRIVYSSGTLKVNGELRAKISIASARAEVSTVGDINVLVPWQIEDILSVHHQPSPELQEFLEAERVKYTTLQSA